LDQGLKPGVFPSRVRRKKSDSTVGTSKDAIFVWAKGHRFRPPNCGHRLKGELPGKVHRAANWKIP